MGNIVSFYSKRGNILNMPFVALELNIGELKGNIYIKPNVKDTLLFVTNTL